ncbi:MAG: Na+/H+ antiporter NhaC family protein [Timaviella obliquedivisa GSE-PSE-MK23-08B]|jgi:NhaC family Na+:H+ antiporter|nr:Na+/H+ antiporter NhaC family protein [Timaviella obliquedivisa GSE-PSE-MK23-08B]
MDLFFALLCSFVLLVLSVTQGVFVAYPLLVAMTLIVAMLMRRGFELKDLLQMAWRGSRQSVPVFSVLLLIGAVMAVWMAAGTVPAIVYYGIQLISPSYFILLAFALTSLVSLLIGTSFGAAGTIGLALMMMAKGSDVDPHIIAGAIISGAYVGDRCSPMSSGANLIASITQTNLYTNIQNMWRTSWLPLSASVALFGLMSWLHPVLITDQSFSQNIRQTFHLSWINLLPALTIVGLSWAQVEVKLSMLVSIAVASAIALLYQDYSWQELFKFIVFGFELEKSHPLNAILAGGGIVSMLRVTLVVIISTAFVGIFSETRVLEGIETLLSRAKSRSDYFLGTCIIGTGAAAFGCTQTIAILLTQQLVEKKYQENEQGHYQLAIDLENSVVVIAPLIPWNIAGLVPAIILMTDPGFIPFAFYLYLLPLINLLQIGLNHSPPRYIFSRPYRSNI